MEVFVHYNPIPLCTFQPFWELHFFAVHELRKRKNFQTSLKGFFPSPRLRRFRVRLLLVSLHFHSNAPENACQAKTSVQDMRPGIETQEVGGNNSICYLHFIGITYIGIKNGWKIFTIYMYHEYRNCKHKATSQRMSLSKPPNDGSKSYEILRKNVYFVHRIPFLKQNKKKKITPQAFDEETLPEYFNSTSLFHKVKVFNKGEV